MTAHSAIDPRPAAHRRPGLDLLRAVAIVLVVLYHAGLFGFSMPFQVQRFGWIGVDLFFVLSGYLIGGQLLSALARGKSLDLSRFYSRRALRILPAYLFIVLTYCLLPPAIREYERMPPLWKFLSFTQNLGLRGGTSFSHAWSLCIESQFYLALPLLIMVLARLRRGQIAVLSFILLWGIGIRAALAYINFRAPPGPSFGWWQQWIYYPTYSRLDSLTIGVGLAAMESFRPHWWSALTRSASWLWLPGIVSIALALVLAENGLGLVSSAFGFFLVALGCGAFLVCAVSPQLRLAREAIPGSAFLATTAYSIYLTHKLPIHWVEGLRDTHAIPALPAYLVMLGCILLVGSGLFFAVERPFLRIRERATQKH